MWYVVSYAVQSGENMDSMDIWYIFFGSVYDPVIAVSTSYDHSKLYKSEKNDVSDGYGKYAGRCVVYQCHGFTGIGIGSVRHG